MRTVTPIHCRAMKRMRDNRIPTIWAGGGNVINGWLSIASSITAELVASQDFDSGAKTAPLSRR